MERFFLPLAALEIVCSGLGRGDRALYDVYGPDGRKIYSVALQGTGPGKSVSRRITGLKSGVYRVTSAHWDWTYDESPASLELQLSGGEISVFGFTASKRGSLPYNCEEGKLNVFKTQ